MEHPSLSARSSVHSSIHAFIDPFLSWIQAARAAIAAAFPYSASCLSERAVVPRVVRQLSGRKVLATEFIEGLTRLDDRGALAMKGLDRAELGAT